MVAWNVTRTVEGRPARASSINDVLNPAKPVETKSYHSRRTTLFWKQEIMKLSVSITQIVNSSDFIREE